MLNPKPILVVGGYGAVGRYIVEELHSGHPDVEIIVAGRSLERATALASSFGSRVSAGTVDMTSRGSIDAIFPAASLVVLNTEVGSETAARACVDHGVSLISVAASVPVLQAIASLGAEAEAANVALITEVGLAPGLMNLMALAIVADMARAHTLDLVLQLGLVGDHGVEAVNWTMEQSREAGRSARLEPGLSAIGNRVIPMDFLDREKIKDALQVERVTCSLALSPSWSTRWLPSVAAFLLEHPGLLTMSQRALNSISRKLGLPDDAWTLFVRAQSGSQTSMMQLKGNNQSRVTGVVAAKTAGKLFGPGGLSRIGVAGMADLMTLEDILPDLEKLGCRLTMSSHSPASA